MLKENNRQNKMRGKQEIPVSSSSPNIGGGREEGNPSILASTTGIFISSSLCPKEISLSLSLSSNTPLYRYGRNMRLKDDMTWMARKACVRTLPTYRQEDDGRREKRE